MWSVEDLSFTGCDTTSTTIIGAIYELPRTPRALKAVRDELDKLFGSNSFASNKQTTTYERLLADGGHTRIYRMTYISAVLKEVLRLHPLPDQSVHRLWKEDLLFLHQKPSTAWIARALYTWTTFSYIAIKPFTEITRRYSCQSAGFNLKTPYP